MAQQQKPAWVYLLAGLIIGLFVAGLVYLSQQDGKPVDIKQSIEQNAKRIKDTREVRQQSSDAPTAPKLDFYGMLPKLEVSVSPDLDVSVAPKPQALPQIQPESQPPTSVTTSSELYYLQVGAFSKRSSADSQKAKLILSNWPTKVQQVRLSNGNNIYRVFVGPYNQGTELKQAEKGLTKQGLQPVKQKAS